MFRFGRDFLPGAAPVTGPEVLSSIASIGAAIEIVSSRLSGWSQAPKLNQLADLQNHGALIIGSFIDYDDGFRCNCGCGAPDPDCRSAFVSACDECDELNCFANGFEDCKSKLDFANNAICR